MADGDTTKAKARYIDLLAGEFQREAVGHAASGAAALAIEGARAAKKKTTSVVKSMLSRLAQITGGAFIILIFYANVGGDIRAIPQYAKFAVEVVAHGWDYAKASREYDQEVARLEKQYAEINPDSPAYNPNTARQVLERYAQYYQQGMRPSDAIHRATTEVMNWR